MTTDDATNASSVRVNGTVSRTAISQQNVNIAFVIDVSGSMGFSFSGANIADKNGNGSSNELLDGAIEGYEALLDSIINDANLPNARIGVIPFENTSSINLIAPASRDQDNDGISDIVESLRSLRDGGGTAYEAGLLRAIEFFNSSPTGSNYVFFLSDGEPNTLDFDSQVQELKDPTGINATIRAIGLGNGASLDALDLVDDNTDNNTAIRVTSPSTLAAGLTGSSVNQAEIGRVEILLNGTVVRTLPPSALTSTPLGLNFDVTIPGLRINATDVVTARVVATDPAATVVSTSQTIENGSDAGGNDTVFGEDGNDSIMTYGGADIIDGGSGDDRVDAGGDGDIVSGGSGNDTIDGGAGADTLNGGFDDDIIQGGSEADLIFGDSGDDTIDGGTGADAMLGGGGNDRYTFDNAGDTASELAGEGIDTVLASVAHTLRPNFENLTLTGTATNAFGSSVANILTGNAQNNTLNGKEANDIMTGGAGIDTFMFDTALGAANVDRITDFRPVDDVFRLAATIFTRISTGVLIADAFRAGTSAADASDRIIYNQATGQVFYDADGLGGAAQVLFAVLDNRPTSVTSADFVIL